jgi:Tfp pilus assembly protein PilZ
MNGRERRKHPRVKKQLRLILHRRRFYFLWEGRDAAELVDISNGGAQINTKRILELGDKIVLSLQPKIYSPPIHFYGKIVWVRTQYRENLKYRQIGVQFVRIGPIQRRAIARLLKTVSP